MEYLRGERHEFQLGLRQSVPNSSCRSGTLAQIPFGATWSYRQLAERIGRPTATRAVGAANGRNPLPIVLPCHQVIGNNGTLTGFGGGLPTKTARC